MSLSELMIEIPAEYEANVFGQFDVYVKKLERTFHVTLISRDGATKIVGERAAAEKVQRILNQLVELARRGNTITEQNVDYAISLVFEDQEQQLVDIDKDLICHTLQGKPIKPKTLGQKKYGCHSQWHDHVRTWSCRNRKDLSCNGDGNHSL